MTPRGPASKAASSVGLWLCLGCGESAELGSYVVWHADHESADLSEWEAAPQGNGEVMLNASISAEQAHSGSYSLRLDGSADAPTMGAGFDFNLLREAYFSAWYYLPDAYGAITGWPILAFASRGTGCTGPDATCEGVEVMLRSLESDQLLVYLFNHEPDVLQPPLSDPTVYVPIQRWFFLEVRYRRATDHSGIFHVWLDGEPLYGYDGWRTAEFDNLFWGINNPPTADAVVYVDDVAISQVPVTPDGRLE